MGGRYSPLDMNQNPFQQAVLEQITTRPNGMVKGRFFYDSVLGPGYYDGTSFRPWDAKFLTDGSIPIAALAKNPLDRQQHTGSQASSTISDLATVVQGYALNLFAAPTGPLNVGNQRLTSVASATADTDAVNFGQIKQAISQAIAGQTAIKNPVRGVFTSNITLSGVQNTPDGVTGSTTDPVNRWLVAGQTDAKQGGIYSMQTGAWVRVADADEPAEWKEGTEVLVLSGTTYGGTIWRQTGAGTNGVVTPGTDSFNFTMTTKINTYTADGMSITLTGMQFSVKVKAGGGILFDANGLYIDPSTTTSKKAFTIPGDGSTAQFTVQHNLNNTRPGIFFFEPSGARCEIDYAPIDANSVRVTFGANSIPANGVNFGVEVYA